MTATTPRPSRTTTAPTCDYCGARLNPFTAVGPLCQECAEERQPFDPRELIAPPPTPADRLAQRLAVAARWDDYTCADCNVTFAGLVSLPRRYCPRCDPAGERDA